ncbi:hypothetical protein L1049_011809 [Liquidambar formosana]|uniref:MULE transposase domain-containing protein n=1 Tax=Liquidambar formosana TaxID=63359 RepID=A0AAP0RX76_LIQFO
MKIYGKVEDNYKLVPWICKRSMESNPIMIAECTAIDKGHFKQLFMACGCLINGFLSGLRPILFLDSSHLSGSYKGALVSAAALDANNHMFPLAYRVISLENHEDWLCFLQCVRALLENLDVTIVSDRHQALNSSVSQVFSYNKHAHYFRHLKENFSSEVNKLGIGQEECKETCIAFAS